MMLDQWNIGIRMLTAGMRACDVTCHFSIHISTISRLKRQGQATCRQTPENNSQKKSISHDVIEAKPFLVLLKACLKVAPFQTAPSIDIYVPLGWFDHRHYVGVPLMHRHCRDCLNEVLWWNHRAGCCSLPSTRQCVCIPSMITPNHTVPGTHSTQHNINALDWPSRSGDRSLIGHLLDQLERKVSQRGDVNTVNDLARALRKEWDRISRLETIRKLICSIHKQCDVALRVFVGHTRYW